MSYGGTDSSSNTAEDSYFTTPAGHNGVTFIASSGDSGASSGVSYPAASPNVVGVGGTTLTTGAGGAYVSESGWNDGGGGISTLYSQPSYQKGVVTQSTTNRTVPDVSFDADPNSGVPVYDSYDNGASRPWEQVGGTSLAAPMWAGVIAIADQGRALNKLNTLDGPTNTLPMLYGLPSSDFHDVTSGNNGYSAGPGYDLVTGRGTPIVNLVVQGLSGTASTTGSPTIGSFSANPTSVTSGVSATLTASGVMETGGTISGVTFYRESNGTSGLQIGSDTAIGTGTQNGSTWTISASTTGLAAGTYTYYAIATDASGVSSAVSSTTLTVTTGTPTIGSFTVNPTSVTTGASVTLTASSVTEAGGTISSVTFYRESNGTSGLQIGSDTKIGVGTQNSSTWTISTSTTGLAAGTYTYYAVATDAASVSSAVSSTTLTVTSSSTPTPTIGSFTITPTSVTSGTPATLTASNVAETGGTISSVNFYLESNGVSGLQTGSDTLIGAGKQSGSTWTTSASTSGLAAGTYTYYAVAIDGAGHSSAVASATLSVTSSSAQAVTVTQLSAGPVTYYWNGTASVVLTATVTSAPGSPPPTGTVELIYNGSTLVTGTIQIVNGVAKVKFTVQFSSYSDWYWDYYTFTAKYDGAAGFSGSISSPLTVAV